MVILLVMKTAVSISDELFAKAEKYAKRKKMSRSHLYSRALEEYINKEEKRRLIDRINKVCREVDTSLDPFWKQAQARAITKDKW